MNTVTPNSPDWCENGATLDQSAKNHRRKIMFFSHVDVVPFCTEVSDSVRIRDTYPEGNGHATVG